MRVKWVGLVRACLLTLWFSPVVNGAVAAEFQVLPGSPTLVTVSGEFQSGDHKKFVQSTLHLDDAIVLFQSNGGNLASALEIGKAIRLKNFGTYVPDQVICASACALAWLGGTQRFMSRTARIGFHAAYMVDGGTPIESGMANALVGAYLNSLGLPDRAVAYMTAAAPEQMQWLTPEVSQNLGLNVSLLDLTSRSPQPNQLSPPPEPVGPPAQIEESSPPPVKMSNLNVCRLKDTMILGSLTLVVNGKQLRKVGRGDHIRLIGIDEREDLRLALNARSPLDSAVRLPILNTGPGERYYLVYWWHIYSLTRINGSVIGQQGNFQVFEVDANEFHRLCPRMKPKTLDLAGD